MRKITSLKLHLFLYCYSCEIFHMKFLKKSTVFFDSQEYQTLKKTDKKKKNNLQKQKVLDLQVLRPHAKAPFIIDKI